MSKHIELNVGMKYNVVKWSLEETLTVLKNYNLKKISEYGLNRSEKSISAKTRLMKLPLIIRRTPTSQKNINNKIYKYVITICHYYNKNRKLNMKYIGKISKKHLVIVKNCLPKAYFNVIMRETIVLDFIDKNKRLPRLNSKNKKEKSLAEFVNIVQYNKKNTLFLSELEKVKLKNGIKSKVGELKPKKEDTINYLIGFIVKNKRIPSTTAEGADAYERKLGRFFGSVFRPSGISYDAELIAPFKELVDKYGDNLLYNKSPEYFAEKRRAAKLKTVNERRAKHGISAAKSLEEHYQDRSQPWFKEIVWGHLPRSSK